MGRPGFVETQTIPLGVSHRYRGRFYPLPTTSNSVISKDMDLKFGMLIAVHASNYKFCQTLFFSFAVATSQDKQHYLLFIDTIKDDDVYLVMKEQNNCC